MFDYILELTDQQLATYVFDVWTALIDAIDELAFILWTVQLVYLSYKAIIKKDISAGDFAWKFFQSAVILSVVLSLDNLIFLIYGAAINIPEAIANFFFQTLGQNEDALRVTMDDLWERGIGIASEYWQKGGLTNLVAWGMSILLALVLLAVTMYSIFQLVRAKLGLAIILSLAPLAIVCLLSDQTKFLFDGWRRKVLGLAFLPIIIFGLLTFLSGFMITTTNDLHNFAVTQNQIPSLEMIFAYILINAGAAYLLKDSHNIAANLVGDTPLTASNAGRHAAAAGSVAGGLAAKGGGAAWNAAKTQWNKRQQRT